jgi:zinc transporter 1/2/3
LNIEPCKKIPVQNDVGRSEDSVSGPNITDSNSHSHGNNPSRNDRSDCESSRRGTSGEGTSGEGTSVKITPRPSIPGREDDFSYPPGGEDHLGHQRDHMDGDQFAAQMTALFILEFGVIFHSIFIGLTLAVTGSDFNILYIVLVFHQTFEGLGLGSRLATAHWPKPKRWLPWVLGTAYGLTTPIAIAAGLGVSETFSPNSNTTMVVNGVFDAISAGILIYTGLVELMAHEFMFNPEMRKSSIKMMLFAFACMCVGAGLMALLGKWA